MWNFAVCNSLLSLTHCLPCSGIELARKRSIGADAYPNGNQLRSHKAPQGFPVLAEAAKLQKGALSANPSPTIRSSSGERRLRCLIH